MKDPDDNSTAIHKAVAVESIPVVVYDACVLFPSFLRDVLLRVAAADMVSCHWSDEIQDEWSRNLRELRPDLDPDKISSIRAKMEDAFPDARVDNYQRHIPGLTNHPKDRHVLAVAIEGRATQIVTSNLKDFSKEDLSPHGVIAVSPDGFLTALHASDAATLLSTLNRHRSGLQRPALTPAAYVEQCEHNLLPELGRLLLNDPRL